VLLPHHNIIGLLVEKHYKNDKNKDLYYNKIKKMKNKIEIIKTLIIIILIGIIGYYFANNWFIQRLSRERNATVIEVQNEIYKTVKNTGKVIINEYQTKDGKLSVIDNVILVELNE